MERKLAEILAQAEGGPINYQGKNVTLSYKIPVIKDQEIEIEILQDTLKHKQGIALSVDKRNIDHDGAGNCWNSSRPYTVQ